MVVTQRTQLVRCQYFLGLGQIFQIHHFHSQVTAIVQNITVSDSRHFFLFAHVFDYFLWVYPGGVHVVWC